jgi:hypothetical protein
MASTCVSDGRTLSDVASSTLGVGVVDVAGMVGAGLEDEKKERRLRRSVKDMVCAGVCGPHMRGSGFSGAIPPTPPRPSIFRKERRMSAVRRTRCSSRPLTSRDPRVPLALRRPRQPPILLIDGASCAYTADSGGVILRGRSVEGRDGFNPLYISRLGSVVEALRTLIPATTRMDRELRPASCARGPRKADAFSVREVQSAHRARRVDVNTRRNDQWHYMKKLRRGGGRLLVPHPAWASEVEGKPGFRARIHPSSHLCALRFVPCSLPRADAFSHAASD